jgi:hypothetical protein
MGLGTGTYSLLGGLSPMYEGYNTARSEDSAQEGDFGGCRHCDELWILWHELR